MKNEKFFHPNPLIGVHFFPISEAIARAEDGFARRMAKSFYNATKTGNNTLTKYYECLLHESTLNIQNTAKAELIRINETQDQKQDKSGNIEQSIRERIIDEPIKTKDVSEPMIDIVVMQTPNA